MVKRVVFFILFFSMFAGTAAMSDPGTYKRLIRQNELAVLIERKAWSKVHFELVDLRLEKDFALGHIPGAINIPLSKLASTAERFFPDKTVKIILYGYSQGDLASTNSLIILSQKGYQDASLLEEGFAGWEGLQEQ